MSSQSPPTSCSSRRDGVAVAGRDEVKGAAAAWVRPASRRDASSELVHSGVKSHPHNNTHQDVQKTALVYKPGQKNSKNSVVEASGGGRVVLDPPLGGGRRMESWRASRLRCWCLPRRVFGALHVFIFWPPILQRERELMPNSFCYFI